MKIESNIIGKLNKQDVVKYSLINDNGMKITALNLGGIITEIKVKDRFNNFENVVLAYKDWRDYIDNPSYLGAIIGRTAGRIADGKVELCGETLEFNKNYNRNQGHGGINGFNKKFWKVDTLKDETTIKLIFTTISKAYEEGYPGEAYIKVEYILNNKDEFLISYEGKTTETTLMNLTNHSYFNLSGNHKKDILKHKLKVGSSQYLETVNESTPTGKLLDTKDTVLDFNKEKLLKDVINNNFVKAERGLDHCFILDKDKKIILIDDESGRTLEMTTNNTSTVIYSGNYPDNRALIEGGNYIERLGICLEAQEPPIGYNNAFIEKSILEANTVYSKWTKFRFNVI
ncbi:aldose 1-epimerase [Clostridium cavendishii DSM 21758]|uniref:Aldose 1-epimerase n=1 Tax=Clostridium cavendishii DSM 21758 TaxID=1121302 RepID=A0A1M6UIF0_9CLOT|nr:aldose epimerase family protein [Clostridium cavendishii]SHK68878.1 aldose 1-epimerase [Clostridium cavendishii DSM 21758]